MILHIINKSPYTHNSLKQCLELCTDGCSIIFIENGVLAATAISTDQLELLKGRNISLYLLQADVLARGLKNKIPAAFNIVSDEAFVELTSNHHSSQSWF